MQLKVLHLPDVLEGRIDILIPRRPKKARHLFQRAARFHEGHGSCGIDQTGKKKSEHFEATVDNAADEDRN